MRAQDRERTSAARVEAALHTNADDLLAFAERRVGRDDAPDVLAEVMLVAWRRAADLPPDPQEARMWLFGVARGVVANALRGQLRRHQLADRLRAQTGPQAQGAPADRGLDVRDAIDRLEPDLAEVVRLVHWEGLSLTDTARLLDTPPSTIRSRYAKAREHLAGALHPAPSSPA
jgi:RNA polymerase sigma-70 factor (ECF subfamily)